MIAGVLIGLPALRLKGDYLAIITLAFGEIIRVLVQNIKITGGAMGMGGIGKYTNFSWGFFWTVMVVAFTFLLVNSRHGRAIKSVREDEIAAEKKYMDPFKFRPTHTLVLYTNHLPRVGAMDTGIWRRLIVIPFDAKITGRSDIKNYSKYLLEHAGPAIVRWIIEGAEKVIAADYQLKLPLCVHAAIEQYRSENDWMAHFLDACCVVEDGREEKSGELYSAYRAFCSRSGEYTRSTTEFYNTLSQRGFQRTKTRNGIIVRGIELCDFTS